MIYEQGEFTPAEMFTRLLKQCCEESFWQYTAGAEVTICISLLSTLGRLYVGQKDIDAKKQKFDKSRVGAVLEFGTPSGSIEIVGIDLFLRGCSALLSNEMSDRFISQRANSTRAIRKVLLLQLKDLGDINLLCSEDEFKYQTIFKEISKILPPTV